MVIQLFFSERGVMLFLLAQRQGCGSGSGAGKDPYALNYRIRIRIQNMDTYPDPGVKNGPPMLQKSVRKHPKKSLSLFGIFFS